MRITLIGALDFTIKLLHVLGIKQKLRAGATVDSSNKYLTHFNQRNYSGVSDLCRVGF